MRDFRRLLSRTRGGGLLGEACLPLHEHRLMEVALEILEALEER